MFKLRPFLAILLLTLPLTAGCDSGTPATPIATAISTSVVPMPTATADTLPTPLSAAATAVATPGDSAVIAAGTVLTGAATAVTGVLSGTLSASDQAYLQQVSSIATGVVNAPAMTAAANELATAAGNGALGGNVDMVALNTKLTKAGAVLDTAATQAGALHPSTNMQSIQTELLKALSDWQGSLKAAQTAAGSQNWTDAVAAIGRLGSAGSEMSTLLSDLAARGMK